MRKAVKKWGSGLLAAVLAFTMVLSVPNSMTIPASAVTRQEINKLKENANSLAAQKKDLQKQMAAVAADKNKALEQKRLLEQQINVIQSEIDNLSQQIVQYDQYIAEKQAELVQIQAEEAKQYELFCQRVRVMEEEGEVSYWAILFDSSDFSELLDRFMMVEEIMEYDNAVMDQLIAIREQIKIDKADLEAARQSKEESKRAEVAAQNELKTQKAAVEKLIVEINAKEDQLEKAEQQLKAAAAAMDAEIKKKEKELAAQLAAAGTKIVSEAGFIWPLSSAKTITSFFGSRKHPITGKANNHTGIDIAAAGGTPILAAKSGVVITSSYNNSYGNYVVISHGNGQTTLYAHMSRRGVAANATVKQGQTIGYVGSTGSSTGNHLHYEIRINGNRRDPLDYYKGSKLYVRANGTTQSYTVP